MKPILMLTPDSSATFTTTVVIAGISIVLGMLVLLIIVFYCFGKIVSDIDGKNSKKNKKGKGAQMQQTAQMPIPQTNNFAAPAVEQGISEEVVAAITAAVAQYEGDGAVIQSIRTLRVKEAPSRNPWAQAAVIDNAKSF